MDAIEKALAGRLARAIYEGREENRGKVPDEQVSKVIDTLNGIEPSRVEAIVVMAVLNTGNEPFTEVKGRQFVELDTEFGVAASAAALEAMTRLVLYGMKKQVAEATGDSCQCELCQLRRALLEDPALTEQLLGDGVKIEELQSKDVH